MANQAIPFSSGPGGSVTDGESGWSRMARYFVSNGVLPRPYGLVTFHADPFAVYADSTGLQVKVRSGAGFVMGHYGHEDAEQIVTIAANSSGNPRIDRIVRRLNWTTKQITTVPIAGTPAATPAAPGLTFSNTIWDEPLAQVAVANGALTLAPAAVTVDERNWVGDQIILFKTDPLTAVRSSIDIPSTIIPQTLRSLELRVRARSDVAAASTGLRLRFNSDTGANYDHILHYAKQTTTDVPVPTFAATSLNTGAVPGASALANLFSQHRIEIEGYSDAQNKTILARYAFKTNVTAGTMEIGHLAGFWRSNSPITSLSVFPLAGNFAIGTHVDLIGIPR